MPNWCEGNIRFRGKKKDIVRLVLESFEPVTENSKIKFEDNELFSTQQKYEDFYIEGTQRCFVGGFHTYIDVEDDEDVTVLYLDGFRAAWSIKDTGFRELAKKYNVDIKCVGFEQGGCFYQVVTFYKDGRKKEEYKEYDPDDWNWECLFPGLGG